MTRPVLPRPRSRLTVGVAIALSGMITACGGDAAGPPQPPPGADVVVTGNNAFQFDPTEVEVDTGDELGLVCAGSIPHNILVATEAEDVLVVECGGLEAATGVIDVAPGEYEFFCNIPGHREAGMEGTITVQ